MIYKKEKTKVHQSKIAVNLLYIVKLILVRKIWYFVSGLDSER